MFSMFFSSVGVLTFSQCQNVGVNISIDSDSIFHVGFSSLFRVTVRLPFLGAFFFFLQ